MASLYQRFSGKINTSRSFPVPPEASHLLGAQCSEEDGAAGKTPRPLQQESSRPRFQYQPRSDCEEEDVSAGLARVWVGSVSGAPRGVRVCSPPGLRRCYERSWRFLSLLSVCLSSSSSPEVLGTVRDRARAEPSRACPPRCFPAPLTSLLVRLSSAAEQGWGARGQHVWEQRGQAPRISLRASRHGFFFFFSFFLNYSIFTFYHSPGAQVFTLFLPPSFPVSLPQPDRGESF